MPRTPLASRTTVKRLAPSQRGRTSEGKADGRCGSARCPGFFSEKREKLAQVKRSGAGRRHLPAHEGRKPALAREPFLGGGSHVAPFSRVGVCGRGLG